MLNEVYPVAFYALFHCKDCIIKAYGCIYFILERLRVKECTLTPQTTSAFWIRNTSIKLFKYLPG